MAYYLGPKEAERLFQLLREQVQIFGPVETEEQALDGRALVAYREVEHFDQLVWDRLADRPAKEAISPLKEMMLYFKDDQALPAEGWEKDRLIFARPCDVVSQEIQDNIFLKNGGLVDAYYQRAIARTHFAMMECQGEERNCFCLSMGGVENDRWAIACKRTEDGGLMAEVKEENWQGLFDQAGAAQVAYRFSYVEENDLQAERPDLSDEEVRRAVMEDSLWEMYGNLCVNALQCTATCPTCTCFTIYDELGHGADWDAVRYRKHASCMGEDYERMAKQKGMRQDNAARTRFRVMHKVYDYEARFGGRPMCTGCGRCINNCPKHINIVMIMKQMKRAAEKYQREKETSGAISQGGDQ